MRRGQHGGHQPGGRAADSIATGHEHERLPRRVGDAAKHPVSTFMSRIYPGESLLLLHS